MSAGGSFELRPRVPVSLFFPKMIDAEHGAIERFRDRPQNVREAFASPKDQLSFAAFLVASATIGRNFVSTTSIVRAAVQTRFARSLPACCACAIE